MAKGAQVEPDDIDPNAPPADPPVADPEPPEEPASSPKIDRRAEVMDSIHETRRALLEADGVDLGAEAPPEPDPTDGADDRDAVPPAVEEPDDGTPAIDEPAKATPPQDTMVEVPLEGGGTEKIPLSQVVAGYGQRATADHRLKIANDTLLQAEQRRDRLTQGGDRPRPSGEEGAGGDTPQGQTDAKSPLDDVDWGALGQKVQYDSPDDAGNALRSMVEQIIEGGTVADPAAVRDELTSQVREQLQWDQAAERFQTDYKDLAEDPIRAQIVGNLANAYWDHAVEHAKNTGAPRPDFWAVWDAAGKATREWLGKQSDFGKTDDDPPKDPEPSPDPIPSIAITPDRTERKRVAAQPPEPRQPQAPALRDTPGDQPTGEQALMNTRRAAIAEKQTARGQHA